MLAEQLDKILKDHKLWIESGFKKGTQADLSNVDLSNVDLSNANLRGADLRCTDLSNVDLCGADLSGANLSNVDLSNVDLSNADLSNADLSGAYLPLYKIFPEEGSFIAWKKLTKGYLAKILIPEDALRCSNLISRKGRSNKIKILVIYDRIGNIYTDKDPIKCWSGNYNNTYLAGNTYETELDTDIRIDCTKGFHFFLTKEEAFAW